MAKPDRHADSTALRFGGAPEDYIELFATLDASKGFFSDNRHRYCSHTSMLINVACRVWGEMWIRASDQTPVSTRALVELHILEDYGQRLLQDRKEGGARGRGFIPTVDDWLAPLPLTAWMLGPAYGVPPSREEVTPTPRHSMPAPNDAVWFEADLLPGDHEREDAAWLEPRSCAYAAQIHRFLDQCWEYFPDRRALALTHNPYWVYMLVPRAFPETLRDLNGSEIDAREVARRHCYRELGCVPTLGDWIGPRTYERWMQNGAGAPPPSARRQHSSSASTRVRP